MDGKITIKKLLDFKPGGGRLKGKRRLRNMDDIKWDLRKTVVRRTKK